MATLPGEEEAESSGDLAGLQLEAIIGFNGHVPCGLICHPDREHLIYPLGCTVIVQGINIRTQNFLHGHTNNVSCVTISSSGSYVASGQITFMGFKADIILWDYKKKEMLARLSLHKGKIENLAFSPNDLYLVSLGGQDDGSGTIRVWELDLPNRKIRPTECQTGQLKRIVTCMMMMDDDKYFYIGTSTGDVLKINTESTLMSDYGPAKEKFSLGVTALLLLKTGDLVIGTGTGIVAHCSGSNYKVKKKVQLQGAITSITPRGQGHQFFVGTEEAHIYRFSYSDFKDELIVTCHNEAIHDIIFPYGTSDLFATCSKSDIRVWYTPENRELLRITIPNMTCHAIDFMRDGKSIISAWNDGKIRAFTPETGQLMYAIEHAHSMGVTAVTTTSDCKRIISGGGEGQVRVWEVGKETRKLEEVMKEHISAISCIKIKKNNQECVTASIDGTCIIWDLVRFMRRQMILANTLFKCVCYHPDEHQLITSGTDRKIGYWEVFDGSPIRDLEGSLSGSINGMDITSDGTYFVTGGDDHLVKVWDYNEGEVTFVGVGHSGSITRLKICPNNKYIVSVSADGAILRWKYPHVH
ncbi:cilia- and flagella-associated protein 52 isoform X2 [Sceloporus undulatus]|uniref:cilia- and flagella-associated protein 52 isoform X2 n=1 Tax=Sceloporus undulatus TaxID=8520 RepID=UPI001C4CAF14|nr:cilia- and flagella-associated protein 52 isoform X2 [Sceloporus undulatus]